MPRRTLSLGPVRTTIGLADVHFDGEVLRLVVWRRPLDVLDRYRLVLAAAALTVGLGALSLPAPTRWTVLGASALLVAVVAALPRRSGTAEDWPEPDLRLMDPVHGALRVHLVLHTVSGDLRLSGWFWRRRQLDHLQRVLGEDRAP